MTLDSLPDLEYKRVVSCKDSFHGTDVLAVSEHGAPGRRPNIHAHFVGRQREDGLDTRPAPPRTTEALSSRTSRSRPWKRRSQAVRERKPSVLRACRGGNVRKRVNEKGRCNLRFAKRTSGAINARTEGDTACGEEEHRVGRGVKPDLGNAGSLRPAEHAATPAADVGGRGGRRARARVV